MSATKTLTKPKTRTTSKKKVAKFLKFNLALDEGLQEIINKIDNQYPEFKFNNSAKVRFALGELSRRKKAEESEWAFFDDYYNSKDPISKKEMVEDQQKAIDWWMKNKEKLRSQ